MIRSIVRTLVVLAVASAAAAAAAQEDADGFRVFWNDGLRMETGDGRFQLRLGGRLQNDWVFWIDEEDVASGVGGALDDGTEFRRLRFFLQGYVYERIEYKVELDFAAGRVTIKDVYFGVRHPTFGLRIGHMKEPFSLEEMTSSNHITFAERSLPAVFNRVRNNGVMLHGEILDGDFMYGAGVFRETDDDGVGIEPDGYNVAGRFAGALVNRDGARRVIHVGTSLAYQNGDGSPRVFSERPEVHLAPDFVSSGPIPTDGTAVVAVEAATVTGPLSLQAEYKAAMVSSEATGDPTFTGWYVFGTYFLTGESRPYAGAEFDRVRPRRNLFEDGLGAFELGARYAALDLAADGVDRSGGPIIGTRLSDITLGLNWYWNPHTVMKLNLIRADIDAVGDVWAVVWRGQVDF